MVVEILVVELSPPAKQSEMSLERSSLWDPVVGLGAGEIKIILHPRPGHLGANSIGRVDEWRERGRGMAGSSPIKREVHPIWGMLLLPEVQMWGHTFTHVVLDNPPRNAGADGRAKNRRSRPRNCEPL